MHICILSIYSRDKRALFDIPHFNITNIYANSYHKNIYGTAALHGCDLHTYCVQHTLHHTA